jgi:DNA-binding Xre family transcriptional regulator
MVQCFKYRVGADSMIRLRVKELAEKRGLNMAQLARKADIDQRTLRRIYRDPTQEISALVLGKLATALNVSPGDLLEVIDDK